MSADDLYENMKQALRDFGLSFHDKDKVEVRLAERSVTFIYRDSARTFFDMSSP